MRLILGLLLAICSSLADWTHGGEALDEGIQKALQTESYIYVATQRLNGEWSTPAPVWFMSEGGKVYFTTSPSSHKAHRIHRRSTVRIWVGRKDGPSFDGEARFIKDTTMIEQMGAAYDRKYWLAWVGLFRPRAGRVTAGSTVAIEVSPTGMTRP